MLGEYLFHLISAEIMLETSPWDLIYILISFLYAVSLCTSIIGFWNVGIANVYVSFRVECFGIS